MIRIAYLREGAPASAGVFRSDRIDRRAVLVRRVSALLAGLLVLSSCGQTATPTEASDASADKATARVESERDRTDATERERDRTDATERERQGAAMAAQHREHSRTESPERAIHPTAPAPQNERQPLSLPPQR